MTTLQITLIIIEAIALTTVGYLWGCVNMAKTASEFIKLCIDENSKESKECSKLP